MSRFFNPFPQFFNSTPNVLSGAQLFFYAAGSNTKINTYPTLADRIAGTNPNANPIVLNSSGYPPGDIYLQNQAYKIVLAPSTDSDPPTSAIWSTDNYWGTDFSSVVETKVGSGSPAGNVAGTASSAGVLPTFYWDYTNGILYVCTATGPSATAGWTALNASASTPSVPAPQGYLTILSGTPVITSDQASVGAAYYTPDKGNLIPIYNGAGFIPTQFAELGLTLTSSHALNTIYDVFVWSQAGVLTIGTGPAWSNSTAGSCARGTGASTTQLARVNGLLVNAVQMTARNGSTTYTVGANLGTYVGSIFIDGTAGQITCHRSWGQSRKWSIWNAYNQRRIVLKAGDSTGSWGPYNVAAFRASNANSANSATVFCGNPDCLIESVNTQYMSFGSATTGGTGNVGIGWNSTTVASGTYGSMATASAANIAPAATVAARYVAPPALGINVVTALEEGNASRAPSFAGGELNCSLELSWMG